jgi:hypothetical protein
MTSMKCALSMTARFGLLIVAAYCSACVDPCGNEVISEQYSPNREFRAVVFQRDCGATTGFSTQVSVLAAKQRFPTEGSWLQSTKPGNVFVADTDHGNAPSGSGGGPDIRLEWTGPRHLRITHDKRARVSVRQKKIDIVDVEYLAR